MNPSEKLPEQAQARLNTNKNTNYVLDNLPEGVPKPPSTLTCINCKNCMWSATEKEATGYCKVKFIHVHTEKEKGRIVICSENIPILEGVESTESAPTQNQEVIPFNEPEVPTQQSNTSEDDAIINDLLNM